MVIEVNEEYFEEYMKGLDNAGRNLRSDMAKIFNPGGRTNMAVLG